MILTLVLWLCIGLNLFAFSYHMMLRRRLKRDRSHDAEMLNLAAHIVRSAGSGDYLDGATADFVARDLEQQAMRALILAGRYDKEMREWIKRNGEGDPGFL